MSLETGTNVSDLNSSNPTTGDNASEGDDHLRSGQGSTEDRVS